MNRIINGLFVLSFGAAMTLATGRKRGQPGNIPSSRAERRQGNRQEPRRPTHDL